MPTQVDATRRQIIALAKRERGTRTRDELLAGFDGMAPNTYANFESGKAWPRSTTLRQIERLMGWQDGIIDVVMESGMEPTMLTLRHMHGDEPIVAPDEDLTSKPTTILTLEINQRMAEIQRRLAASEGGGSGIAPDDLPHE